MTGLLRGFFLVYFLLGLRKKETLEKKPAKNVRPNSVHIVIPYSLSRENAIFATLITPLEKSNDLRNLISLEEFSCGTSSGRSFLRYFFLFFGCDPWSLISFFEILSKTFAKQTIYFKKISYRLLCVSFFILTLQGLGRGVVE